jgi:hypothetical protein
MTPRLWILTVEAVLAILTINLGLGFGYRPAIYVGLGVFIAALIPIIRIGWFKGKA